MAWKANCTGAHPKLEELKKMAQDIRMEMEKEKERVEDKETIKEQSKEIEKYKKQLKMYQDKYGKLN